MIVKLTREAAKPGSRKTAGIRLALPNFRATASPVTFEQMRRNDQRGKKLLLRERRAR